MKYITLVTALVAAIPAAFGLTVNSPASVLTCEPTQFTWSGGMSPYFLSLVPAGQASATPLKQFPTQNGNSYTWNVDLASGVSFTVSLKDSSGATAYSSIITVLAGSSTNCANSTVQESSSGSGSGAAASTGGSGSTSAAATSAASATGASSSGSATSTATGNSPSRSSAADRLSVSAFGAAGIMGLVGAMLF